MRMVKRDEFLTLPKGTIFQEYTPQVFSEPMVFHGAIQPLSEKDLPNDFVYSNLFGSIEGSTGSDWDCDFMDRIENGEQLPFRWEADVTCRWGLYPGPEQMFLVWDKGDILRLMGQLSNIMKRDAYKGEPDQVMMLTPPQR